MGLDAGLAEVIMGKVEAFVEGLRGLWQRVPEGSRLYVAEHRALAAVREMARTALEGVVEAMGTGHCGPRHTGADGVTRSFKCYVTRTVETVVGSITVRAAQYYRKGARPATLCPLWDSLGLSGGEYSQGMEEVIALAGARDVYREGLTLVNRLTGANVSVHKAETTVASWGGEAKARVKAALARRGTAVERVAATRPVPGLRMCVTTDATSVQTTEGWRDAKLVASYRFDERGEKVGPAAYAATLHYQADYGDLLWHLMEETRASRAEETVWLGDGAGWIWNQQALVAPEAVAIVDFYHASDRLWKVGRALHRDGPPAPRQAKRWSQKWIRNLYAGKGRALRAELGRHCDRLGPPPKDAPEDEPRRVLADAARYFTNNAERMDYPHYRARGYPIGSGVVESACRHLVGLRMKRTATMAWHEDNAEALLQLRCLTASDAWDRFWGFDALWRHIRARAA